MRQVLAVVVLLLGLHAALSSDVTELGKGGISKSRHTNQYTA